ncbi:MAG: DNA methylase, partial [Gemmatimonadota bacterium]
VPPARLCLSSPPFMCHGDHQDPLTGYTHPSLGYERYLDQLAQIYLAVAHRLLPSGHLVIEIANLKKDDIVTTLAWDLAGRLRTRLQFLGETIVAWDRYGYGYDHSYCLLFRAPVGSS